MPGKIDEFRFAVSTAAMKKEKIHHEIKSQAIVKTAGFVCCIVFGCARGLYRRMPESTVVSGSGYRFGSI